MLIERNFNRSRFQPGVQGESRPLGLQLARCLVVPVEASQSMISHSKAATPEEHEATVQCRERLLR